jgi:hypothetical protein
MVIEPASGNRSDSVGGSNAGLCEKTSEEVANDSADCVGCEDIKGIIVLEDELELGSEVANCASRNAE